LEARRLSDFYYFMSIAILGSGSWATALAKILTDNNLTINWWIRNESVIKHIKKRHHNPNYISSVFFDANLLSLSNDLEYVISKSDLIIVAIPSAYIIETIGALKKGILNEKKIISAVKGILPENNLLLNEYLQKEFHLEMSDYFTVMGPCHAEEVAAEKLSYLTLSGCDVPTAKKIASYFTTEYLNTIVNNDVYGVQFAAVLKNIYALGAGIAHGLEYGDNFLSVLIANCADEMAGFLRKVGIQNIEVGIHGRKDPVSHKRKGNYAASVYLGDLLVTCYSLYSRNRTFGNMIGKGYSVQAAKLELNMVAEGYTASKCIYNINKKIKAEMPIAATIYKILWQDVNSGKGFKQIEQVLV
jgi:glycerol-3-phosphate dehydrogenase (NAD(P)+)